MLIEVTVPEYSAIRYPTVAAYVNIDELVVGVHKG
jgi:hypothetical protein